MKHPAINLVAAASDLRASHPSFANAIVAFRDANSLHTDLSMACDMLEAVGHATQFVEAGHHWAAHSVPALIYSSVLLYVRATKSKSKHRMTFDVRSKLSDSEKELHARLCELRDTAFAHFGPGVIDGGAWHEEHVVLPLDNPIGLQIVAASKRIGFSPRFVRQVSAHVQRVTILAQREAQRREVNLAEAFDAVASDEIVRTVLNQHRIDLHDLFEGISERELSVESRQPGVRTMAWSDQLPRDSTP